MGDSSKFKTFDPKLPGMKRPLKPIPVFKQNPGEHKRAFYYRMDKTIQSMKKRAQFEDKYKVDVQMDAEGNSKIVDREKDEIEVEMEEKRQARREREKKRKKKNKGGDDDFSHLNDNVEFGEVAHAPPTLKFKNFEKSSASRPAQDGKNQLLLNNNSSPIVKKKKKKMKMSMAQKVLTEKNR